MTRQRLKYLLDRYLGDRATEEELKEYEDWYKLKGATGMNMVSEQDGFYLDGPTKAYTVNLYNRITDDIYENENQQNKKKTDSLARVLKRIAALHSLHINASSKGYTIRKDLK